VDIDEDEMNACVDLVARTGATGLRYGPGRDGVPTAEADWWAYAQYRGARICVEHQAGPLEALGALCRRLMTGAQCACGRLIALSDDEAVAFPTGRLLDGSAWGVEQAQRAGQCRWRRVGPRWVRSCEGHPSEAGDDMHTTEKLARALEELDDPALAEMVARARAGYYHDYLSPLALPEMQLHADLCNAGHHVFAQRVINGEFDASKAEAAAWAASPEGQEAFAELVGGGGRQGNRAERRSKGQRGKHSKQGRRR
jgi:hypothetical protein